MYMWHEKHYVGAAHGIVGIIYILLQVTKPESLAYSVAVINSK